MHTAFPLVGQNNVGEDQIGFGIALKKGLRFFKGTGGERRIARVLQDAFRQDQ
jgi:hypothetical protein